MRRARERGARTVAICDRSTAPAAIAAELSLAVPSANMMFTNSIAALSIVLNALTTEVALRDHDHAAEASGEITRILREARDVVEEDR